ncbi:S-adenosylmethionine:tRNA ribosyltransferase-isomerase [Oceanobacillus luteolus]|uniref:S-adenosylmethionine:tRNA ribosyltransferase-isomerase n=1 Tax=Oceanobacillus luteolus TaxID=1274358 RepID=A0ABW4HU99_9BACI
MIDQVKVLDFKLPGELYAREPKKEGERSRMIIGTKYNNSFKHSFVDEIYKELEPGDTLIINNSKTVNGVIYGKSSEFGILQFHLLRIEEDESVVKVFIRDDLIDSIVGETFEVSNRLLITLIERKEGKEYFAKFNLDIANVFEELSKHGEPIISNYAKHKLSIEDYQNEISTTLGSLENPVASGHFKRKIISDLKEKGINIGYITLNCISMEAYITENKYSDHIVPPEIFNVPEETAELITTTKKNNKKIISVGTTATRTLESLEYDNDYNITSPLTKKTDLAIYPGYNFKIVDGVVTNFHGPRSSRLALAAACISEEKIMNLYKEAIKEKYMFYEFGDCMLLWLNK